jgi:alkanesulfonate monooxygenase SsuD/methylene tetrahydromethanopterin reductase-like flavin-dependent oxidoreductase (luciferase family)
VLSFGIKTNPVHTTYQDLLRVWQAADAAPLIEHAWLWDHFLPLYGPVDGPILEGWTLLAALAARTERLDLGLMVTNNRARRPAVLAKIASTVDQVANGRLVLGIGVGGTRLARPGQHLAEREYAAYGIDLVPPADGIAALAETCVLLRRMWTEPVVDFAGTQYAVTGAYCEPKPVRPGGPPILIGASGRRALRVVAEHADIWNVPGPHHNSLDYLRERSRVLDEHCAAIGRDPASIVRSTQLVVRPDDLATPRATVFELADAGFTHLVLNVGAPFPDDLVPRLVGEIIEPTLAR